MLRPYTTLYKDPEYQCNQILSIGYRIENMQMDGWTGKLTYLPCMHSVSAYRVKAEEANGLQKKFYVMYMSQ
jgi:hypothetical protein